MVDRWFDYEIPGVSATVEIVRASDYDALRERLAAMQRSMDEVRPFTDRIVARLAEAEALLRGDISRALTAPLDDWKGVLERKALDGIRAFLTPADSADDEYHYEELDRMLKQEAKAHAHAETVNADSADASPYPHWKCPHCGWDNVDSVCFACKRTPDCDHLWSADDSDGVLLCLRCGHKEPKRSSS